MLLYIACEVLDWLDLNLVLSLLGHYIVPVHVVYTVIGKEELTLCAQREAGTTKEKTRIFKQYRHFLHIFWVFLLRVSELFDLNSFCVICSIAFLFLHG